MCAKLFIHFLLGIYVPICTCLRTYIVFKHKDVC